jgi:hypothetical protein
VGLITLATLAFATPRAGAYVYWADFKADTIGRAANDGSVVEPAFIRLTGGPVDVEVNATHIFWADENGKAIGRANLDGTNIAPHFVSTGNKPSGLAVNGSNIYWASILGNAVGRAKLDGTGATPALISGAAGASDVALDSGHVYWTSGIGDGNIGRADLNGNLPNYEYVHFAGTPFLRGIAVNTSNIFWADWGLGGGTNIGRANVLTGQGPDASFIGDARGPCSVAVLGSQLYWSNTKTNTIGRANTDSSGVNQSLIAVGGAESICGMAVDALAPPPPPPQPPAGPGPSAPDTASPETTIVKGPGAKLAKGKAKFGFSSSEAGSRFECKLDGRKVAACKSPKRYAGLEPGRHAFKAWATDAAGNKDPTPAKRSFRVPEA